MEDRELVALVLEEPVSGVDLELEAVRRGGGVAAADVALRRRRRAGRRARTPRSAPPSRACASSSRANARPGSPPDGSLHRALDVRRASQKSAERYFQPPSASTQTTTPSSSSAASAARDVDDGAGRRRRRRCPPCRAARGAPATDSSFETSSFRSSFDDVEDRRHVAVVERAQAHHRVAGKRLCGRDDDVREASRAAARPAPISVPPVPRPATSTSTRSSASAISAPVPS